MPTGQLHIRTSNDGAWIDAYDAYGMSLDQTALSALMTPAPNKALIENSSRLEHGKRITPSMPRVDSRSLTLSFNITAKDEEQFMQRYAALCELLEGGYIEMKTSFQKDVIYKMYYESCSQFSQFRRSIGKFSLKLNEPNPKDRS